MSDDETTEVTLWDRYAMAALSGFVAGNNPSRCTNWAAEYADTMMELRKEHLKK